jgi:hypothetical protein
MISLSDFDGVTGGSFCFFDSFLVVESIEELSSSLSFFDVLFLQNDLLSSDEESLLSLSSLLCLSPDLVYDLFFVVFLRIESSNSFFIFCAVSSGDNIAINNNIVIIIIVIILIIN